MPEQERKQAEKREQAKTTEAEQTDATTKGNVSRELLSELEKVDANAWRQFPR